jgi:hypothetical protein
MQEGWDAPFQLAQEPQIDVLSEASFSAVKGVSFLSLSGKQFVLSVGYSQQLCLWSVNNDKSSTLPRVKSRAPVDLGDVNSMSICTAASDNQGCECWVAVCGMGVEMFRIQNST